MPILYVSGCKFSAWKGGMAGCTSCLWCQRGKNDITGCKYHTVGVNM